MTNEVDLSDRQQGWPPDQFHPVYGSFREWLDSEAPPAPLVSQETKSRNLRKYVKRRKK